MLFSAMIRHRNPFSTNYMVLWELLYRQSYRINAVIGITIGSACPTGLMEPIGFQRELMVILENLLFGLIAALAAWNTKALVALDWITPERPLPAQGFHHSRWYMTELREFKQAKRCLKCR